MNYCDRCGSPSCCAEHEWEPDIDKEDLMKWLQEQAAGAEQLYKNPGGAWADYDYEYYQGMMAAFNEVWRYLNESEN